MVKFVSFYSEVISTTMQYSQCIWSIQVVVWFLVHCPHAVKGSVLLLFQVTFNGFHCT